MPDPGVDTVVRRFRERSRGAVDLARSAMPRPANLDPLTAERARDHLLAMLPERFERGPDEHPEIVPAEDLIAATTAAADAAFALLEVIADPETLEKAGALRADRDLFVRGARKCWDCGRTLALYEFGEAPAAPDGSFRKRRCVDCERKRPGYCIVDVVATLGHVGSRRIRACRAANDHRFVRIPVGGPAGPRRRRGACCAPWTRVG